MNPVLVETLRQAQRFGFFGSRPIDDAIAHSADFVAPLRALPAGSRIIDIGSGGGLPGLVIGNELHAAEITLLDRREKRTDFLAQAVSKLGWHHVHVRCCDVTELIRDIELGRIGAFDAVTARGFGPPDVTLRAAVKLSKISGIIVVSEPPTRDRWPTALLAELGVSRSRCGAVAVFERTPRL